MTTWYKPYEKASNENKKRGASGALYNTYKRKLYRKIGLLKNSNKQSMTVIIVPTKVIK